MSAFEVDKFLFEMKDSARWARFLTEPRVVLAEYALRHEEAAALEGTDLAALHRLGANGYLLLSFGHRVVGESGQVVARIGQEPAAAAAEGD